MHQFTVNKKYILLLVTFCALSLHLLAPVNPAYGIPIFPEISSLFILAILSFFLGLENRRGLKSISCVPKIDAFYILVLFILIVSLFPRVYFAWVDFSLLDDHLCSQAGGALYTWECYLQASVNQNHVIRQYVTLLFAFTIAVYFYFLVKKQELPASIVERAVVMLSFVLVVGGLFSILAGALQLPYLYNLLPDRLMYNTWGRIRFTQIIGNPSWVWPYLSPALCIVLGNALEKNKKTFSKQYLNLSILASIIVALVILMTRQRGGLVLVLGLSCLFVIYTIERSFFKKSYVKVLLLSFLCLAGYILFYYYSNGKIIERLMREPRYHIYAAGFELIQPKLLEGHGYGSWHQIISNYSRTIKTPVAIAYDTAHNLYIQTIAELGLIHSFWIFVTLSFLPIKILFTKNISPSLHFKTTAGVFSFLVITMIQEVDYIRPVFYMHAAFWALLYSQRPAHKEEPLIILNIFRLQMNYKVAHATLILFLLLGVLLSGSLFSFGGSAFEKEVKKNTVTLTRWLSPTSNLTTLRNTQNKSYSVFKINNVVQLNSLFLNDSSLSVDINQKSNLVLSNPTSFPFARNQLLFSKGFADNTRFISAQIQYPPLQTNLGIWNFKNKDAPQDNMVEGLRVDNKGHYYQMCFGNCQIEFSTCGWKSQAGLVVYSTKKFQLNVEDFQNKTELAHQFIYYKKNEKKIFVITEDDFIEYNFNQLKGSNGSKYKASIKSNQNRLFYFLNIQSRSLDPIHIYADCNSQLD